MRTITSDDLLDAVASDLRRCGLPVSVYGTCGNDRGHVCLTPHGARVLVAWSPPRELGEAFNDPAREVTIEAMRAAIEAILRGLGFGVEVDQTGQYPTLWVTGRAV